MNLVWFLTIGTLSSLILGELGHYPFGVSGAVSLTDILLSLALVFLAIWQIGIKKKIEISKNFKYLSLFWLVGILSLVLSGNFGGYLYLIRFIVYGLAFWLGYSLVKSKVTKLEVINDLIILVAVILSFIGFMQLLIFPDLGSLTDFGFDPHQGRLVSSFLDPNFIGAFLSIGALISVWQYRLLRKRMFLGAFVILVIAIVLTFSRSAYLMLIVELTLFSLLKFKKMLVGIVILLLAAYFLIPRFSERINGALSLDKSAAERIVSWQNGLSVFSKHPLLGVGFNNLRDEFEKDNLFKVFSANGGHSGGGVDSSLIFTLATTGILGLAAFLLFWSFLIWSNKGKQENFYLLIILAGLLVDSQFINSLFYPPIMLTVFLLSGAVDGQGS